MANPNGNPQNLTPFEPGKSGNPDGRPKGIQNWSELVRDLLADEKLADKLLSKKPGWWSNLPQKNAGNAIVVTMMIQAMGGDVKAATWLRQAGFGDKLDLTSGDKPVRPVAIFDMRQGVPLMLAPMPVEPEPVVRKKVAAKSKTTKKKATKKPAAKSK